MKGSIERLAPVITARSCVPRIIEALESHGEAMKATELAKLMGVTRQHVYKMAAAGMIPSFRVGKAVRFDPGLVAEWLRRKMPKPALPSSWEHIAV